MMAKRSLVSIPVVDFGKCSLDVPDEDLKISDLKNVGDVLCKTFHEVGFAYLKHSGISQDQVDEAYALLNEFLKLPECDKAKYLRKQGSQQGWVPLDTERVNKDTPYDYRQSFNYLPICEQEYNKLNEDVPQFRSCLSAMYALCDKLMKRILDALGYGMNLTDPQYFSRVHNPYTKDNLTTLRLIYYPPVEGELLPKQLSCGEHTDWGSITLLFQDNTGGLEVLSNGEFVGATPVPETVIINIGDLLQRWSSDYFISNVHRVVMPTNGGLKSRYSMAFFGNPDNDCEIISVDGGKGQNKYKEPVLMRDFIKQKMTDTY